MSKQIRLIPALAFGMALLSISTLANAEVILNVTQATLVAKGAGVEVSVEVTCDETLGVSTVAFGGLLTQRTGNSITNANLSVTETLTCTGLAQTLDFLVAANSPGKPFKKGPAFISITASVFTFPPDSGASQQEIQIQR